MKNFKMITATIAIAASFAAPALAGGLSGPIAEASPVAADLSGRNDGLTHQVMCSNVPGQGGTVPGVFAPNLGYFVEAAYADKVATDRIAGVIPAGLSSKDATELSAYFASVGLTNFELVIRNQSDRKQIEETRLVEVQPMAVASALEAISVIAEPQPAPEVEEPQPAPEVEEPQPAPEVEVPTVTPEPIFIEEVFTVTVRTNGPADRWCH